jgi:hypothetical protein
MGGSRGAAWGGCGRLHGEMRGAGAGVPCQAPGREGDGVGAVAGAAAGRAGNVLQGASSRPPSHGLVSTPHRLVARWSRTVNENRARGGVGVAQRKSLHVPTAAARRAEFGFCQHVARMAVALLHEREGGQPLSGLAAACSNSTCMEWAVVQPMGAAQMGTAEDTPPSSEDPLDPLERRLVQRIAQTTHRSWAPIPPEALSMVYPVKEEQALLQCLSSAPDVTVGALKHHPAGNLDLARNAQQLTADPTGSAAALAAALASHPGALPPLESRGVALAAAFTRPATLNQRLSFSNTTRRTQRVCLQGVPACCRSAEGTHTRRRVHTQATAPTTACLLESSARHQSTSISFWAGRWEHRVARS